MFSPDGQLLAFDGDDRADDAREIDLHVLELRTGAVSRLTDGAVATRRPVFVDRRHLVAERRSVAGPTLVVVDRERLRTQPIGDHPDGEREPAAHLRATSDKKKPRLLIAYARRESAPGAENDAVWVGELKGLKITTEYEAVEDAASAARTEAERAGLPTIGGET